MTLTETIHDVLETGGTASRHALPGTYEEKIWSKFAQLLNATELPS